ncbi:MAG: FmdB family zinc ribbon protein [Chloroflexota bacterium]
MPLYDYICTNGHITEVMHGVYDQGPATCGRCGAEMRKLLSTPAIVFKGSGWAKKDRSSKPVPKTTSATDHEAKSSSSSDAKSTKSGTDSAGAKSESGASNTSSSGTPGDG